MVIGRSLRATVAWLGRLVGLNRQKWVEPGNAITRAVLSGAELTLPELPVAAPLTWDSEAGVTTAVGPPEPQTSFEPTLGGTDGSPTDDDSPADGRWRAA